MPCFNPLQASFLTREDGKKDVTFSNAKADLFYKNDIFVSTEDSLMLPCGRCIGCRLERSRQWAVRIMHESQLYDENSFITLTFDDEHLVKECPNGSLQKSHVQNFLKRLRQKFSDRIIRYFACGEYGEDFQRPHYHLCLFNIDFCDKLLFSVKDGIRLYTSEILSKLWTFGFSTVGSLTFESAAYVARYCTKKISGALKEAHYAGRQEEFALMSLKPGIGFGWLQKYGKTDCWTHDEIIVNGHACKPPRYYDKKLESIDPERFLAFKEARQARARDKCADSVFSRLQVREKIAKSRFKRLGREYEQFNLDF